MYKYIFRRLLAMLPTLIGISIITFALCQIVPGGPVDTKIQQIRYGNGGGGNAGIEITDDLRKEIEKQFGFDKPPLERYFRWLWGIVRFDFGESYFYKVPVISLIVDRLPVSLTFGLANFILVYLISIPLGIAKALKHGGRFDAVSSLVLFVMYSIPPFALGILLIVFFAGGSYFDWFPLQGLMSDNWDELTRWEQIKDYLHHACLPLFCYVIGHFAAVTILMKNSLIEQLSQDYKRTAEAKGLRRRAVIFKHCLRNALIPIATGIGSYIGLFLAGSLLIEEVFGLDGIGRLVYEATMNRDYPVVLAEIFLVSLMTVLGNLISDLLYVLIDPRIDFS